MSYTCYHAFNDRSNLFLWYAQKAHAFLFPVHTLCMYSLLSIHTVQTGCHGHTVCTGYHGHTEYVLVTMDTQSMYWLPWTHRVCTGYHGHTEYVLVTMDIHNMYSSTWLSIVYT